METKEKITHAGFALFSDKGYHRTNTIEIAKYANVSTGAVYSYFKDKRSIFIEAFEQYLQRFSSMLFEELDKQANPFELKKFIDTWISSYIEIYADSSYVLLQLRMMMMEDTGINNHFCNLEKEYVAKVASILKDNGIKINNLNEKVYISCILIDTLNREKNEFPHQSFDYAVLFKQTEAAVLTLLSK